MIFLLSPARCNGPRAELLATSRASELGAQLRGQGAPIGEVFAWLSALYFRGKLAYARAFASRGRAFVIAPGLGLLDPDARISADQLREMGAIDVESEAFAPPLHAAATALRARTGARARVVLLGSIATPKYTATLLDVFGSRLLFPSAFVGRGDMSRGGLMLRAARTGVPLVYARLAGAALHGARPPKLARSPHVTPSVRGAAQRA